MQMLIFMLEPLDKANLTSVSTIKAKGTHLEQSSGHALAFHNVIQSWEGQAQFAAMVEH